MIMGESNLSSNIKLGEPSEKPEVMAVARNVWIKAVRRVREEGDGRKIALAEGDFPFRKTLVISTPRDENFLAGGRLKEIGGRGGNVDLVITAITESNDGKGGRTMAITSNEIYYFSPGSVYKGKRSKGVTIISPHPDEGELQDLLNLVSSAKIPSHSVKIVPWSK